MEIRNVPADVETCRGASVRSGWTVGVSDVGPGVGDVTHSDTFHTARPRRDGGVAQVTSVSLCSSDMLRSSERRKQLLASKFTSNV